MRHGWRWLVWVGAMGMVFGACSQVSESNANRTIPPPTALPVVQPTVVPPTEPPATAIPPEASPQPTAVLPQVVLLPGCEDANCASGFLLEGESYGVPCVGVSAEWAERTVIHVTDRGSLYAIRHLDPELFLIADFVRDCFQPPTGGGSRPVWGAVIPPGVNPQAAERLVCSFGAMDFETRAERGCHELRDLQISVTLAMFETFVTALRVGDLASAEALTSSVYVASGDVASFLDDYPWFVTDAHPPVAFVNASWAWTTPRPVITAVSSQDPTLTAAFVAGTNYRLDRATITRLPAAALASTPPPGSPVAAGDVIDVPVMLAEGGIRAYVNGGEPVPFDFDPNTYMLTVVVPEDLDPGPFVLTVSAATPEAPLGHALAFVLTE